MAFASGRFGDIRFSLTSREKGKEFIEDPINWDDSEREYKRNRDFRGIFSKLSNNLEFTKRGFRYLIDMYQSFGIEPDIILEKEAKNTERADERWEVIENGYLNLSELNWSDQLRTAKVKFDEVGFWQSINNRKGQKHDLIPTVTVDGVDIGELPTRTLRVSGRAIFLRSELEINPDFENFFNVSMPTFSGSGNRTGNKGLPFRVKTNSDQENIQTAFDSGLEGYSDNQNGTGRSEFFLNSNRFKQNVIFTMNFKFKIQNVVVNDTRSEGFTIYFRKYTNGLSLQLDPNTDVVLLHIPDPQNRIGETFEVNHTITTNINPGDSFAYVAQTFARRRNSFVDFSLDCELTDLEGSLVVEENSVFPSSGHEVILPHEKFERLVAILTGQKNSFYSEYFGRTDLGYAENGPGAYMACASGFMVREFPNIVNPGTDQEKTIQYKTSFRDLYESYDSITPLAAFIEGDGVNVRLRIEPVEFIYQKFLGVNLKRNDKFLQVTELDRKVDTERIYSHIKLGSKTELRYLEAFGLDEFNGMSEFITIHTKVENIYEAISEYRKDSYGHEFARRQRYPDAPEADTRYDQDIFMLDCKVVSGPSLQLRLWQDDFEKAPTGIYSPDTVFNLRFSPANTLINHSILFGASLLQYQNSSTAFASSNSNSSLATKKANQPEIREDGSILNSNLKRPLFLPETFEFELPVSNELIKKIEGNNENNIPNIFGYLRMETRDGFEYVYIDNLKISDNGRFTCTKAWL